MIRASRTTRPKVIEQRLLLHNVSWDEYETIALVLRGRSAMRLTYDRGNLEICTTASRSAPRAWTSDTQRLVLDFIDWADYEKLLQALERHHLRTTYDQGTLELMTLSPEHENYVGVIRLLIGVLAEEFRVPVKDLGSTTCRRKDRDRGLEPDKCFYIANRPKIRGKKRLDLTVDPPPDLAVEVDITRSSLDRLKVYASLGIGEVWRFDGARLQVYRLTEAVEYEVVDRSPSWPSVRLDAAVPLIKAGVDLDDTSVTRSFRHWARQQHQHPDASQPEKRAGPKRKNPRKN